MGISKYGPIIPRTWNISRWSSPKGKNRATRRQEARIRRLEIKEAYAINARIDHRNGGKA